MFQWGYKVKRKSKLKGWNPHPSVKRSKRTKRKEKLNEGLAILVSIIITGTLLYGSDLLLQETTGYRIAGIEEGARVIRAGIGLLAGKMTFLEDPTFDEMCKFVEDDKTNSNYYIPYNYVCEDFAKNTIKNAKAQGIKVGYVEMETLDGSGHAIVAFNTTDRGLYFLEPQLDVIFSDEEMNKMIEERCYFVSRDYGFYHEYFDFVPTGYVIDWSYVG